MTQTRREFLRLTAGAAVGALTCWAKPSEPCTAAGRRAAVKFLFAHQSPDGAWRSTGYGAFRDGDALTPLVLWALTSGSGIANTVRVTRGLRWLEKLTATQATRAEPWAELRYPLFTAGYAAQIFARVHDTRRAMFWADLVEQLRISRSLGWPGEDAACGAWSDAPAPPRLPPGGSPPPDMLAPNISATLLGLRALVSVGRRGRTAAARPFLAGCQNFAARAAGEFDDGGFFFAPGDPVRNKAGVAGRDTQGGERYRSYGSATCDGLLALDACGARLCDPAMHAAMGWLRRHASGMEHGGHWPADRADDRESLVHYYAQALAGVLAVASTSPELDRWAGEQRRALTAELLARQASDGSCAGVYPGSFEDDSLLATAFALRALAPAGSAGTG